MTKTLVKVGRLILCRQATLLTSIHDEFKTYVDEIVTAKGIQGGPQGITSRWILSELIANLQHHIDYRCEVRKYGTVIYRRNADLLLPLSEALWKLRKGKNSQSETSRHSCDESEEENTMGSCFNDISHRIHAQIRAFLAQDHAVPFEYDKLDFDELIKQFDSDLWKMVCLLTRSISDLRGTSKVHSTAHHTKRARRLFLLCTILFCTDDRCSMPLHTLLTDTIESQGGSGLLIKLLNQLGVCASADTLSRFIQYKASTFSKNKLKCLNPESFTIVSADNIDFMHSFAQVFCGRQKSSWHGTTVQATQPLPSLSAIEVVHSTSNYHVNATPTEVGFTAPSHSFEGPSLSSEDHSFSYLDPSPSLTDPPDRIFHSSIEAVQGEAVRGEPLHHAELGSQRKATDSSPGDLPVSDPSASCMDLSLSCLNPSLSCEDSSLSLTDHSDRIFHSSVEAVREEPLHHAELGSQRKVTDSSPGDLPVSDPSASCMDLSLSNLNPSLSCDDSSLSLTDHSDRIFHSSVEAVREESLHHAELDSQWKATDSSPGDLHVSDPSASCMELSLSCLNPSLSCKDPSLSLTDHYDRIFHSSVEVVQGKAVRGEPLHHAELGSQRKATDPILGDLPVSCMDSFSHTDHAVSSMDLSLSREDASLSIKDPSLYCPDQCKDECNQCNGPMPVHQLTRKRIERSSPIVSPLKSTRSPLPKVQRRHRTGTEYRQLQACTTTSEIPQPTQNSKAPSFTGITLQDFLMNDDERDALQDLNEELNTYMLHKHATYKSTVELPFLGMQDFFSLV